MKGQNGEVTKDKNAFFAHIRHELRTPLNAIIGYSEMLLEDAESLHQKAFIPDLEKIHSAGKHLLAVVNEMLDSSKIESGKRDFDVETFRAELSNELRTPLNQIIGYSEMLLDEAEDVRQKIFIPDLKRIQAAGQRLLELATSFIDMSQPRVTPDGAAADQISKTKSAVSVIREIVDQENLRIEVEHASILVVDDIETNRDILTRRLARQGHTVTVAHGGPQALEAMAANTFDLVLLDVIMPEMNGYQVLARIKDDPLLRHIPVLMISALDEINSVVKCIEMGAEDYLPKPFNSVLLKARIEACLEKKRLRDREALHLQRIEKEKKRADDLLEVIFPPEIIEELKTTDSVKPRYFENVAVLFCDIVGFTAYCDKNKPDEVLSNLQLLVHAFEDIAIEYDLEKIKTIGDSFMAAAGLLKPLKNPVLNCVKCGLKMVSTARNLPASWAVRIGIHQGSLMAGVVGKRKYQFDIWGDTVNTAARIEEHGLDGHVNVSKIAWEKIKKDCRGESIGLFAAKGKGNLEIFRVDNIKK